MVVPEEEFPVNHFNSQDKSALMDKRIEDASKIFLQFADEQVSIN